ncbi:SsgA family sporulation/cell division regulator [Streptomyces xanthochromogenes]|uniref:SsgA family sporulation/cell division regulator n=1 Tax=Streptomyces xanthochromogenes TaxID=67384 RepID=UPI00342656B1
MNNATTTVTNDDFDALLEASSLGSPRVTAAMGAVPPDARQRFEQAARSPETHRDEPEVSLAEDAASRPHEGFAPSDSAVDLDSRPTTRVIFASTQGSGKTLSLLHHYAAVSAPNSDARGCHKNSLLVVLRSRERLASTLWADLVGEAAEGPWSSAAQERLTALLATRPPTFSRAVGQSTATAAFGAAPLDTTSADLISRPGRIDGWAFPSLPGSVVYPAVLRQLQHAREQVAQCMTATTGSRTPNTVLPLYAMDEADDVLALLPLFTDKCETPTRLVSVDDDARPTRQAHETFRPLTYATSTPPGAEQRWWNLMATRGASSLQHGTSTNRTPRDLWAMQLATSHSAHAAQLACSGCGRAPSVLEQLLQHWRLPAIADQLWQLVMADECHTSRRARPWSVIKELPWLLTPVPPIPDTQWTPQMPSATPDAEFRRAESIADEASTPVTRGPERTDSAVPPLRDQSVQADITGRLHLNQHGTTALPLSVRLEYRTADPYAVETVFGVGETDVAWTFARDLLAGGMHARTGEGDVSIWPNLHTRAGSSRVYIELKPPLGTALVSLPRDRVEEFLRATNVLVLPGSEDSYLTCTPLDLERQLAQLTGHPRGGE